MFELERDAERDESVDLRAEQRARQAVLGDAEAHHAAGLGRGFEHRDVVAEQRQVVRGGQAGGPGADDRHLAAPARGQRVGGVPEEREREDAPRSGCPRAIGSSRSQSCVSGRIDSTPYCSVT